MESQRKMRGEDVTVGRNEIPGLNDDDIPSSFIVGLT